MSAGTEIALYLIRNVGALILLVVVLRGVLHTSRVNFYNPISQLVVRLTNPLLQPLRGIQLPHSHRLRGQAITRIPILEQPAEHLHPLPIRGRIGKPTPVHAVLNQVGRPLGTIGCHTTAARSQDS